MADQNQKNNESESGRFEQGSQDTLQDPGRSLPWPEESDPAGLGDSLEHGGSPADRELAESFARSSEASQVELGQEFADPNFAADRSLGRAFEDPNSTDDRRLGKSFEETSSSARKPPLKDRVHVPHAPRDPRERRILFIGIACALLIFLLVLLFGWLPRHFRNRDTVRLAQQQREAKPVVDAAFVERAKDAAGLAVPGTTIPLTEAYVYARANGYLKARLVDIGDHVRKDQLLAIIDAPDLDQQVDQAREQLRQAEQQLEQQKSQLALAAVTVQRYRVLVTKGVFSRQDGDQQEANYQSAQANVAAAQRNVDAYRANLRRVVALQSYEYVRAPFAGVVTQRNVDVGALISAGGASSGMQSAPAPQGQTSGTGGSQQAGQTNSSGSSGSTSSAATSSQSPGQGGPLFGIADVRRLRILVSVPEGYATAIHAGGHAEVQFQEYSDQPFTGDVTRTSDSIDPNTRTMLVEVQVDNSQGKLFPGMYAVATFPPTPGFEAPLMVTGDAIAVRHDTTVLARVVNGKIDFVPVVLGRDFGSAVEIEDGVRAGDVIVTNITDDVQQGAAVQVKMEKSSEDEPTKPPAQGKPVGGSTQYGSQGVTDRNLQGAQAKQNQKGSGQGRQKTTQKQSGSKP